MELSYRILNVFTAGARLSGNPLCVFTDGRGLADADMQALARQLNLSETTFILPPTRPDATRRVRIFTPALELPFAGHPTLGTAYVVRELARADAGAETGADAGAHVTLEMAAGLVPVQADVTAARARLTLRTAVPPSTRPVAASRPALAQMLGVEEAAVGEPLWVDTGAEQLVVPLRSPADVAAARPDAARLARDGFSPKRGASMAYVWARAGGDVVSARFFFLAGGSVVEDPATGSACANLGGYLLATGHALPLSATVHQGEAVGRPSHLGLHVDARGQIFVSGEVVELGRGTLTL